MVGQLKYYDTIPEKPFAIGKTRRWTRSLDSDGNVIGWSQMHEYFISITFPWRKTIYCINADEPMRGWVRWVIRFLPWQTLYASHS
jgi:hypothetical protein